MREIQERVFFGNGDACFAPMWKAEQRLRDAFNILSGIQQPLPCTAGKTAHERNKVEIVEQCIALKEIIQDLAAAIDVEIGVTKVFGREVTTQGDREL